MEKKKKVLYLSGNMGVTEKIKRAMYDAAKQFVYIGFLLWEVKEYHYHNEAGYKDVYEYAEKELGFKRSSTKNFIAVACTFGNQYYGQFNEKYVQLPSMTLKPEYKDFNYSQLTEMLSMSEPQRQKINPDMTVKEIRAIKKEPEFALEPNVETMKIPLPDDNPDNQSEVGQTSGQTEELKGIIINNIWKDLPPEIIKSIVKAADLRYNPQSTYNIEIKLHKY